MTGGPAERPSWPRTARPSLRQSAAVAARLGQALPPATVEDLTPAPPADDGPVCARCGGRHPTPGGQLPAWARPIGARVEDSPAMLRDRGARPPGRGRDRSRGGC